MNKRMAITVVVTAIVVLMVSARLRQLPLIEKLPTI